MRNMIVFALILAACAAAAQIQPPPQIHTLQVTAPDAAQLHALIDSGQYNVSAVDGPSATVHATAAQRQSLIDAGWRVMDVEAAPEPKTLGLYSSYDSLTAELHTYAALYEHLCRLESIGQSVQGRELWVMLITGNPDYEQDKPAVKLISTMHGNEPVGAELCLYLIHLLLTEYGNDQRITGLVDSTELWVMPLMNPDGLEVNSRFNAQGLDLNRRFPSYPNDFTGTVFNSQMTISGRPPEVAAVMNWSASKTFTLAANFHTGSLVVNYPYDHDQLPSGTEAPSPDDALYRYISMQYSMHNGPMWNSFQFPQGITNGSHWYAITGGLQDWDYRFTGCKHVTVELSNTFRPPEAQLPMFWEDNRDSMLAYVETAHIGVRGIVTNVATGEPVYAKVLVNGNTQPVFTNPRVGNYHRMLLPGAYELEFSAPGYQTKRFDVIVSDGPAVLLDVQLEQPQMPQMTLTNLLLMLLLAIFGLRFIFRKNEDPAPASAAFPIDFM